MFFLADSSVQAVRGPRAMLPSQHRRARGESVAGAREGRARRSPARAALPGPLRGGRR